MTLFRVSYWTILPKRVPESLQKLMYRGKLTDSKKISESSPINGCNVLLIGSKPSDVVQVNKVPTKSELLGYKQVF